MRNQFYYTLKPVLPSRLRLMLRQVRAQSIRNRYGSIWPVHEAAGNVPAGWPGWPNDKQFAFVLSHDVEGKRGLERCRELAEIEMEHGFRSSFNFIPDGEYQVPPVLLSWLRSNGFEVGVHDLRHDGFLFRTRSAFRRHAEAINRHLKEWRAVGFRAGFMLHQLDWLHDLEIDYDSSTFDVDPFEPQTDGVETIFPFWIPKPDPTADAHPRNGSSALEGKGQGNANAGGGTIHPERGYLEMPYTLVQDYTLFLVLQERTTEIWERKLDWIAAKRGMAFLNTHPDYMAMEGEAIRYNEFPVRLYSDFLKRVSDSYTHAYYHGTPCEISNHVRKFKPPQSRPPRQTCMVVYNGYDNDHRVRRYAESLTHRGDKVTVLSLAGSPDLVGVGDLNGVRVRRLFCPSEGKRGKLDYVINYGRFWWLAFRALQSRHFPGGCDLIHVHNMPEALVFAAVRLKSKGAKVILDLHDLMPELYQDKFHLSSRHLAVRLLRMIEAWACRYSHHVIVSNHLWKEKVAGRSRLDGELTAMINHVNLRVFRKRPRTRRDEKFVILYPGSLNRHQGLDIAIDAMVEVTRAIPRAELHIIGEGPELPNLRKQAAELGLREAVLFFPGVNQFEISEQMANADLGVVPKRSDGFGNEAFSTKIMEFMSQGLPAVVSRTKIDSYYFNDEVVCFFESGSAADLAAKIIALAKDREWRIRLGHNGLQLAQETSWEAVESTYLDVVDRLTRTRLPRCSNGIGRE